MAIIAADVLVRARECEGGPFVVVESRGLPLCAIVASGAGRDVSPGELAAMGVGMARLALERSLGEIGVDELGSQVGRLVAINAGHGAMGADQRELGFGVIEAGKVFPVPGGVTGLAASGLSVCAEGCNAPGELAAVRILVTGGTGKILKVIDGGRPVVRGFRWRCSLHGSRSRQQRRAREGRGRRVAIATKNSQMSVAKLEAALLVFRQ